jgi:predicted nucleotidyltransferase component of viral defense system
VTRLTPGLLARHAPRGAGGREAALVDIAQDVLLAHLAQQGLFDMLVFKGGTALRKMYAGTAGRFSTDLDFSLASMTDDPASVTNLLVDAIDGYATDDFTYQVVEKRGKFAVRYSSRLGDVAQLSTKLDIGPAVWLAPVPRPWVPAPVHAAYTLPPSLPTMSLEENLAEKVARLNRRVVARDLYDLWWIGRNSPHSNFDEQLVTHLAALKCWVDTHSLRSATNTWMAVDGARVFDPSAWLTHSCPVDDESIGLLTNPPPNLNQMREQVRSRYQFLNELPQTVAAVTATDRRSIGGIQRLLLELPGARFTGVDLY